MTVIDAAGTWWLLGGKPPWVRDRVALSCIAFDIGGWGQWDDSDRVAGPSRH